MCLLFRPLARSAHPLCRVHCHTAVSYQGILYTGSVCCSINHSGDAVMVDLGASSCVMMRFERARKKQVV